MRYDYQAAFPEANTFGHDTEMVTQFPTMDNGDLTLKLHIEAMMHCMVLLGDRESVAKYIVYLYLI